jgi:acyl carrier protein
MNRKHIVDIIVASIEETGGLMPGAPLDNLNDSTTIAGPGGFVDSIGLTLLALEIEEQLNNQLPQSVSINDDCTMVLQPSPFRTVRTLADYVMSQIQE